MNETTPLTRGVDHARDLIDDDEEDRQAFSHRRVRSRSESIVMEVKEVIVETLESVGETIAGGIETVGETIAEGIEEIKEVLEEDIVPVRVREEGDHTQKLSALGLAVLVFYKVSGGPFGCEPTVKAGGPFFALVGFVLFPLLWSVPEALVTAELGSAYPEPSGSMAWVEEAFGPKASLLCGYFHWVAGATDNAIYPSLFLKYVGAYLGAEKFLAVTAVRFAFSVVITTGLSFINYLGLEIVGNLSIAVCMLSMTPFILICLISIPKIDPMRWLVMPEQDTVWDDDTGGWANTLNFGGVMWHPLLNNLFWNLNSFDVGASFAGEVQNPEQVFPRAMFMSIFLVSFSYILPLLATLGAVDTDQKDWNAGYFTTVLTMIGGPVLGGITVFAAAISNIALFQAEMSGDSYTLMGMGDRGLLPKFFTKRSRFGTPTQGIVVSTVFIYLMSVADFDQLVEMLNCATSLSMLMEFAAFIKLRVIADDVERPYRIPFGVCGCVLFVTPPCLFLAFLLVTASKTTYIYFAGLLGFGICIHFLQKVAKHYELVAYVQAVPRPRKPKAAATQLQ